MLTASRKGGESYAIRQEDGLAGDSDRGVAHGGVGRQAAAGDGQAPTADEPGDEVVTAALASVEPLDTYSAYAW